MRESTSSNAAYDDKSPQSLMSEKDVQKYIQEIRSVQMCINNMKEELEVVEVTLLAAESSDDQDFLASREYGIKVQQREKLVSCIEIAENDLQDLLIELRKYQ